MVKKMNQEFVEEIEAVESVEEVEAVEPVTRMEVIPHPKK